MSQYDLEQTEYDMTNLERHSTYDQFMSLRDTLVFSGKRYVGKAGWKLCIGEKEETVEVLEPQVFKLAFEPDTVNGSGPGSTSLQSRGNYVEYQNGSPYGILTAKINKSGWYRIEHKEEILLRSLVDSKVFCYVAHFPIQPDGTYPSEENANKIAVFDRQGNFSRNFSGSTSGTDPNGSCSVNISFILGDIMQKITAYGVIERNLMKGDILTLRCYNSDLQPNRLVFQPESNWFQIEYKDLPIK